MSDGGATSPELLVPRIDGRGPRRAALEAELRAGVRSGRLRPGVRLPSSRALAARLGVSRRLVVEAYAQLVAEGYLVAQHGSGTRVRQAAQHPPGSRQRSHPGSRGEPGDERHPGAGGERAPARGDRSRPGSRGEPADERRVLSRRPRWDLFPGAPDLSAFPRRAWGAAQRAALAELPDARLGYGDPAGARELREALADHLGRVRGADVGSPGRVVVCAGYAQGLRLLLEGLRDRGARRLAVEEPGYAVTAMLAAAAGLEVVRVRADAGGLDVAALARTRADAVVVAPAHGLPLGGVLGAERRAQLVAWAREGERLVVEDDYDAEFRYDAEPLGALQGLAPDVVALVGTVSKTLAPALRLGWVVAPEDRTGALLGHKALSDMGTGLLDQLALARLIAGGGFDRHVRAMRTRYRARRDAVLAALAAHLPAARAHGVAAGLHVLVELPAGTDEAALVAAAEVRGLRLYGLGLHCAGPPPFPGIVLGYAAHSERELTDAVRLLGELV